MDSSPHSNSAQLVDAGKKEFHDQNFKCAVDTLTKAIELDPSASEAFYFRALAKLNLSGVGYEQRQFGDFIDMRSSALDDLTECIRLNPAHTDAYILRSDLFIGTNYQFPKAIEDLQVVLRLVPNSLPALLKLAAIYQHPMAQDLAQALAFISRAASVDPSNESVINMRLRLNRSLGNTREAIEDLGVLIAKVPTEAKLFVDRSELREQLYDCQGAIADLNSACQISDEWKLVRSQFYILHRQFDLAEKDLFDEAKNGAPNFRHFPHMKLCTIYMGLGQLDKAMQQVNTLLELGPDTMLNSYYSIRAKIYLKLGDAAKALEDCNRVVAMIDEEGAKSSWGVDKSMKASALIKRGAIYSHCKDRTSAHNDFDEAYKLISSAQDYESFGKLGETLMSIGNYQGAVGMFSEIIKAVPNSDKAYFRRGTAHTNLGQNDKAIQDFSECIQLNPNHVEALNARAALYEMKGRNDLAAVDRNAVSDPNLQLHVLPDEFDEWKLFHG